VQHFAFAAAVEDGVAVWAAAEGDGDVDGVVALPDAGGEGDVVDAAVVFRQPVAFVAARGEVLVALAGADGEFLFAVILRRVF